MSTLKLGPIEDDQPVWVTLELPYEPLSERHGD
jgi:hypothetical protein